jgi:hypothetical protein
MMSQLELETLTSVQVRLFNDRFEEQIKTCDQELRKMFSDCQTLKDEQHNEADYYYKK